MKISYNEMSGYGACGAGLVWLHKWLRRRVTQQGNEYRPVPAMPSLQVPFLEVLEDLPPREWGWAFWVLDAKYVRSGEGAEQVAAVLEVMRQRCLAVAAAYLALAPNLENWEVVIWRTVIHEALPRPAGNGEVLQAVYCLGNFLWGGPHFKSKGEALKAYLKACCEAAWNPPTP